MINDSSMYMYNNYLNILDIIKWLYDILFLHK